MATEATRRRTLLAGAAVAGASLMSASRAAARSARAPAATVPAPVLAATWQEGSRHFVGLLAAQDGNVAPACRQELPTRAHGIVVEPQGTLLVVGRRPGDWLLRFDPVRGEVRDWFWGEGEHVFNGHVIRDSAGGRLFTTETSLESGAGSIAVRHPVTFAVLDRWPCAGIDPHELLASDGGLWVANGGIETRPETGRTKHRLEAMDSSLVRLDAASGRITGQWRLEDQRLGLRHLALFAHPASGAMWIGIALQAEHDDPEARRGAPVLAVWDRARGLRAVPLPAGIALSGYGGSLAASRDGFAVTCPKAGKVARWRMLRGDPQWRDALELPEACAIAAGWMGGAGAVLQAATTMPPRRWQLPGSLRLDNHWAVTGVPRSAATDIGAAGG